MAISHGARQSFHKTAGRRSELVKRRVGRKMTRTPGSRRFSTPDCLWWGEDWAEDLGNEVLQDHVRIRHLGSERTGWWRHGNQQGKEELFLPGSPADSQHIQSTWISWYIIHYECDLMQFLDMTQNWSSYNLFSASKCIRSIAKSMQISDQYYTVTICSINSCNKKKKRKKEGKKKRKIRIKNTHREKYKMTLKKKRKKGK